MISHAFIFAAPDARLVDGRGPNAGRPATSASKRFLSKLEGTNAPLPSTGKTFDWSPDGRPIVFIDARPGPEKKDVEGDPIVITRYLYKPDDSEGNSSLNGNRCLHLS